jgi:hypothetical protein
MYSAKVIILWVVSLIIYYYVFKYYFRVNIFLVLSDKLPLIDFCLATLAVERLRFRIFTHEIYSFLNSNNYYRLQHTTRRTLFDCPHKL